MYNAKSGFCGVPAPRYWERLVGLCLQMWSNLGTYRHLQNENIDMEEVESLISHSGYSVVQGHYLSSSVVN